MSTDYNDEATGRPLGRLIDSIVPDELKGKRLPELPDEWRDKVREARRNEVDVP